MDQFDHPLQVKSPQACDRKVVLFDVDDVLMIDDDLNHFISSQLSLLPLTFSTPPKKRFYPTNFFCISTPQQEKHMPYVVFLDELEKSWMDDMSQVQENDNGFPSMSQKHDINDNGEPILG